MSLISDAVRREEGRDDYYGSDSYIKTHRRVTDDHSAETFETIQLKYGGSLGSVQERPEKLYQSGGRPADTRVTNHWLFIRGPQTRNIFNLLFIWKPAAVALQS